MMGRYGNDQLNRFIFIVTMISIVLEIITRRSIFYFIAIILLVWGYYRMFSRDMQRRYAENEKFLGLKDRVTSVFRHSSSDYSSREDKKNYRIFRCPQCKQKIRVPRGRGRIRIRCPKCGNSFIKKS